MTSRGELTIRARSLCRTLVEDHLREDIDLFDTIWDAVWQTLPATQIEDLQAAPQWRQAESTGAVLAALGDTSQAVDALSVIGSVVGAVVTLLNREDKAELIETAHIDAALREQAAQLGAPDHVRRILATSGTSLLAELLSAVDWHGPDAAPNDASTGLLLVEYCEPTENRAPATSVITKVCSRDEAQDLFLPRAKTFVLYVDETEGLILADGWEIEWRSLQARELRMLYLVLRALRHSGVIGKGEIAAIALQDELADDAAVRRVKSDLSRKTYSATDRILRAEKGMGQYSVKRVPYCWLRSEGRPSRLCPGAPA